MKINWGTAIVLIFVGFISFIMYFVIKMNTDKKYEHDLVTKEYYKKELMYQKEIDAEKNARTLKNDIDIQKTIQGLLITFPRELKYEKIIGTISLYRPSNKGLDFVIPIALKDYTLVISKNHMIEGRWDITIDWKYEETPYVFKKSFVY